MVTRNIGWGSGNDYETHTRNFLDGHYTVSVTGRADSFRGTALHAVRKIRTGSHADQSRPHENRQLVHIWQRQSVYWEARTQKTVNVNRLFTEFQFYRKPIR